MASSRLAGTAAVAIVIGGLAVGLSPGASAQVLIVGNDEKQGWDDNLKPIFREPGRDSLTVIDISKPDGPRIASSISLMNSVVGPPTNLAFTPAADIALVANSLEPLVQEWGRRLEPDNKVFLIDLKANPPAVIGTITVGKQPSGMAISPKGDLALVANRADGTISVLSIHGKDVLVLDTVPVGAAGDSVSAVAITPDGKHALATKFNNHKVALLDVNGDKVTYTKLDLPTGPWPYNVAVAPSGKIALTADNGNAGSSDGSVDTVSVIDLEAKPPRIIDRVVVGNDTIGDGPEGIAVSPRGDVAVAAILAGSNMKNAYFYHPNGAIAVLRIDGKKVTHVGDIEVGGLPEGLGFTPDGKYLLVGNYLDQDISILKVDGTTVTNTGKRFKLPGHPASVGMSKQ